MAIKKYFFCGLFFWANVQAKTFIMSLHNDLDYSVIHARSAFHLQEDGKFLLETNAGLMGLCTSTEIGKFVGKTDPSLINKALARAKEQCLSTKNNCTTDFKKGQQLSWRVNDYTAAKKETIFFKNDESTPAAIDEIITFISTLQKDAQESLTLLKASPNLYRLKYKGEKTIKLPLSEKNFFLLSKTGSLHRLDHLAKPIALKDQVATLRSGESIDIKLAISEISKYEKLIYDSSAGANPEGHSEVQFTPCLTID